MERSLSQGRTRKQTERGATYQLSQLNERLQKQGRTLAKLLNDPANVLEVEATYAKWKHDYVLFVQTGDELRQILPGDAEHEKDFSTKLEAANLIKASVEEYLNINRKEEQDRTSIRSGRTHSQTSRRSSVSSTKTRLSLLRLQEAQKKAELSSKSVLLKKKQEIEKQKMELKWKEEQLELEAEIEVSAARSKLIENTEQEMEQDLQTATHQITESQEHEGTGQKERTEAEYSRRRISSHRDEEELNAEGDANRQRRHETHPHGEEEIERVEKDRRHVDLSHSKEGDTSRYVTHPHEHENSIARMMRASRLPILEPDVFYGDVSDFPLWLKSFESYIERSTDSCIERLHFLGKYTGGEARKAILGFLSLRTEDAYEKAKHKLFDRYGNEFSMASSYREKIRDWPVIRSGDGKALREFVDFLSHCQAAMSAYHSLQVLDDHQENSIMLKKLPRHLVDRWRRVVDRWLYEDDTRHPARYPPFTEFVRFLEKESRIACGPVQLANEDRSKDSTSHAKKRTEVRTFSATTDAKQQMESQCSMRECSGHHGIQECDKFLNMALRDRMRVVEREGLCKACLRKGHFWRKCEQKDTCGQCGRRHPTLLHDESLLPKAAATSMQTSTEATESSKGIKCSHSMIVPVYIYTKANSERKRLTYALLDPQSDACFIRESAAESLKTGGEDISLELNTITGKSVVKCTAVRGLVVSPVGDPNSAADLPVTYTRAEISSDKHLIPRRETTQGWSHLAHLTKELPPYFPDTDIEVLIGMNCPKAIKPRDVVPGGDEDPWAVRTMLGWGIVGLVGEDDGGHRCRYVNTGGSPKICHFSFRARTREIDPVQVTRMFEQDFVEPKETGQISLSREDQAFLQRMHEGLVKRADGHYELPLPVREGTEALPNNRCVALKRLHGLAKKLKRNERLMQEYASCMEDSIQKGYAEEVPADQLDLDNGKVWYLPHHGVEHPRKKKLRVVYDCSTEYKNRVLNNHLLSGPDLSNNLTGILCRFREDAVAFCCDIEAMFHQVHVSETDRNCLRFLWWRGGDVDGPIVEYRMTTHLFGATSSPGCAMFALRAAADEYEAEEGEEAAAFIRDDFYIDDGLTSVSDSEKAIELIDHAKKICAGGGFRLCKFSSNSAEVIQMVNPADEQKVKTSDDVKWQQANEHRVLGLLWDTKADVFRFEVTLPDRPISRRGILSMTSSIYDPLGLISPFVLTAKRILQDLCQNGYSWDDLVPTEIRLRWESWEFETSLLKLVQVPRCYKDGTFGQMKKAELHSFSDASLLGYGECSYLRLVDFNDNVSCHLVMSKSRVSPVKSVTVPRLELVAAVAAVKVSEFLKKELKIEGLETIFWTDSKVVIGYVSNETKRFHMFVANRVRYIRDHTSPEQWRYVDTRLNPADHASRGLRARDLINNELWWKGPPFLQSSSESWKIQTHHQVSEDDPEVMKTERRTATTLFSSTDKQDGGFPDLLDRVSYFSTWHRAKRAVANCLRYKRILQGRCHPQSSDRQDGSRRITVSDLDAAEKLMMKEVQKQHIEKEKLRALDPFTDEEGVMRVGGRIGRSSLPAVTAHPMILPRSSHVTDLVVQHYHDKTAHSGRGVTLNEIRASGYWVIGGRGVVSRHIWHCILCRKLRRCPLEQKMAELPADRVEPEGPFTYSAVDLFGPFYIKERRSEVKRWAVLFCCMSSRAVHLETANSLDTDSFIHAFRRFVCRRGPVRQLRCDQGTNFVGGKNEFEKAYEEMDKMKIEQDLLKHNCDMVNFKFNVPHASHMGGSWERLIRCARTALTSLLAKSGHQLDDESLRTLMTEVEALVNSRPLTPVDMSHSDLQPLSPSMLLTMKHKVVLPPPGTFLPHDLYCRRRWRRVQHLTDVFWERWKREFLLAQQQRSKWTRTHENVASGDVVLVVDDNTPRSQWQMGRVVSTYPSADGLVRKVNVVVGSSQYDRPVHRLILLVKRDTPQRS